jgi:hypothetical protein
MGVPYEKTLSPQRHKGTKMNFNQKISRLTLCLGALVANYPPPVADPV